MDGQFAEESQHVTGRKVFSAKVNFWSKNEGQKKRLRHKGRSLRRPDRGKKATIETFRATKTKGDPLIVALGVPIVGPAPPS